MSDTPPTDDPMADPPPADDFDQPRVERVRLEVLPDALPADAPDLHATSIDVPLVVAVEIGRSRQSVKELTQLAEGSIVTLAKRSGDPVDVVVNGRLIARGEVVVLDERLGIRITDIADPLDIERSLQ